ncbi:MULTISPECIES: hypothetical protein [Brucella/Ochrobactrum group]|uniref:Uncharacterized protein n=1 Tax=Ochrobactrum teleogrylli TaxID=2479765 RepID=A0ABD5K635_9HYPH|nr:MULTISPECIES: hypothetical protein [Brucella/Ochrobactrum group]
MLGARSAEEIAAVVGEIAATGDKAIYRPTDVTRRADMEGLGHLPASVSEGSTSSFTMRV